eukprot:3009700-Amphidinium_carterae.1
MTVGHRQNHPGSWASVCVLRRGCATKFTEFCFPWDYNNAIAYATTSISRKQVHKISHGAPKTKRTPAFFLATMHWSWWHENTQFKLAASAETHVDIFFRNTDVN